MELSSQRQLACVACLLATFALHAGAAESPVLGRQLQTTALKSLGCFKDDQGNRVFELGVLNSKDMTPEVCADYCQEQNEDYVYFSVQYGKECWCARAGINYAKLGALGMSSCSIPCSGRAASDCGGFNAFEAFEYTTTGNTEDESAHGEHLGCYRDAGNDRLFGVSFISAGGNTPESCRATCGSGYAFYGLQYGRECFCGTTKEDFSKHGESGACNFRCSGDSDLTCGGFFAMDVYSMGGYISDGPTPVPPSPTPIATESPIPTPTAIEPATPTPIEPPAPPATNIDCMVVIIEAEDIPVVGDWKIVQDPRASGGSYIVWEGLSEGRNNGNPDDIISTTFQVSTPGWYTFKWLMRQPSGVARDKGNDTWLYFPDASHFGPNRSENSYGTFVKVFGNADGEDFLYSGTAEEANHAKSAVGIKFELPGQYTVEIAGRSHGHEIDQLILYRLGGDVNEAAAGCA